MKIELQEYKFKFTGSVEMLMHNIECMNLEKPSNISHEDWENGEKAFEAKLYRNKTTGALVIPTHVWKGHLIKAAKVAGKHGIKPKGKGATYTELVKALCFIQNDSPIEGTIEKERRYVTIQRSKVMRVWPRIRDWSGVLSIVTSDPNHMSRDILHTLLDIGGKFVGIGDYRPDFGRYYVEPLQA